MNSIFDELMERTVLESARPGQTPQQFRQSQYTRDALLLAMRAAKTADRDEVGDAVVALVKALGFLTSFYTELGLRHVQNALVRERTAIIDILHIQQEDQS